jgi:hypothetical protein
MPLTNAADLPCFVQRQGNNLKASSALERMETPVVYFHTQKKSAASLHADLHSGLVASLTLQSDRGRVFTTLVGLRSFVVRLGRGYVWV